MKTAVPNGSLTAFSVATLQLRAIKFESSGPESSSKLDRARPGGLASADHARTSPRPIYQRVGDHLHGTRQASRRAGEQARAQGATPLFLHLPVLPRQ